jgi:hypothetical protein
MSPGREESIYSLLSDYKCKIGRLKAPGTTQRMRLFLGDERSSEDKFFFADVSLGLRFFYSINARKYCVLLQI